MNIQEIIRRDRQEHEDYLDDYLTGATALFLLATWIAHATWRERREEGFAHEKMQTLRAFDCVANMLLPSAESGETIESVSVFPWRRYLFQKAFKFGVIPTPMPLPREIASWADMKLTFQLALFTLFSHEDELASFRHVLHSAHVSQALAKKAANELVAARREMSAIGGLGYGLGAGTYSLAFSLVASHVSIPFVQGVMNSSILAIQLPWDVAMVFNHAAVKIGRNARQLRAINPQRYAQATNIVFRGVSRIRKNFVVVGGSIVASAAYVKLMGWLFAPEKFEPKPLEPKKKK